MARGLAAYGAWRVPGTNGTLGQTYRPKVPFARNRGAEEGRIGGAQSRQSRASLSSARMLRSIIFSAASPSFGSMCATASVGMRMSKCRT
jgi:hypothetical protein